MSIFGAKVELHGYGASCDPLLSSDRMTPDELSNVRYVRQENDTLAKALQEDRELAAVRALKFPPYLKNSVILKHEIISRRLWEVFDRGVTCANHHVVSLGTIGAGSFGTVRAYRAENASGGTFSFVLKIAKSDDLGIMSEIEFINEMNEKDGSDKRKRTPAKRGDRTPARAMDLAPGFVSVLMPRAQGTLDHLVAHQRVKEEDALVIARAVIDELVSLDTAYGLIHSDIKCANFLYTCARNDIFTIHVADYGGLARRGEVPSYGPTYPPPWLDPEITKACDRVALYQVAVMYAIIRNILPDLTQELMHKRTPEEIRKTVSRLFNGAKLSQREREFLCSNHLSGTRRKSPCRIRAGALANGSVSLLTRPALF